MHYGRHTSNRMAKKHKEVKFGIESIMRLAVFSVLIFLAIGFLSNSKSNINIPAFDSKILGAFSPQVEQGQKYIENEVLKIKEQALNQIFDQIKKSVLK